MSNASGDSDSEESQSTVSELLRKSAEKESADRNCSEIMHDSSDQLQTSTSTGGTTSVLSELLVLPIPPAKLEGTGKTGKARVLTSKESLEQLAEKERQKQEQEALKQKRKEERERKKDRKGREEERTRAIKAG